MASITYKIDIEVLKTIATISRIFKFDWNTDDTDYADFLIKFSEISLAYPNPYKIGDYWKAKLTSKSFSNIKDQRYLYATLKI